MGLEPHFNNPGMPEFDSPMQGAIYMMDNHQVEVLPLHPESKIPVTNGWQKTKFSRQTLENIYSIDAGGSRLNYGVNAGLSGLLIVDVDLKGQKQGTVAWQEFQRSNGFVTPPTFTVRSPSGGFHYYFRGKSATSASKLGEGVDTRGAGGQVVCPGSVTEVGTYTIVSDAPIADAPTELLAALEKPIFEIRELLTDVPLDLPHNLEAATEYLKTTPDVCVEGMNGDVNLFKAFANLKDRGVSKGKAWQLIGEHFNPRCLPEFEMDGADEELCQAKLEQGYKSSNAPGIETPEARMAQCEADFKTVKGSTPPKPVGSLPLVSAWLVLNRSTPRRDWIMDGYLLRSFLSITGAPGGTGKSNFEILKALAVVTGKPLLGDKHRVVTPGPFVLFNSEDPLDEMARRIKAFCARLGLSPDSVKDLHLVSGRDYGLIMASTNAKGGVAINEDAVKTLLATVESVGAVALSIDPLFRMHYLDENNNMAIDKLTQAFQRVSTGANCAVSLVHHTNKAALNTKYKKGDDSSSSSQAVFRGAGSLVASARIGHVLTTMNEREASLFAILPEKRRLYFKAELAKANLSAPAEWADWFVSSGQEIDNGETIGVCERIDLVAKAQAEEAGENAVLRENLLDYLKAHVPKEGIELEKLKDGIAGLCEIKVGRTDTLIKKIRELLGSDQEFDIVQPGKRKPHRVTLSGRKATV